MIELMELTWTKEIKGFLKGQGILVDSDLFCVVGAPT